MLRPGDARRQSGYVDRPCCVWLTRYYAVVVEASGGVERYRPGNVAGSNWLIEPCTSTVRSRQKRVRGLVGPGHALALLDVDGVRHEHGIASRLANHHALGDDNLRLQCRVHAVMIGKLTRIAEIGLRRRRVWGNVVGHPCLFGIVGHGPVLDRAGYTLRVEPYNGVSLLYDQSLRLVALGVGNR